MDDSIIKSNSQAPKTSTTSRPDLANKVWKQVDNAVDVKSMTYFNGNGKAKLIIDFGEEVLKILIGG